jgi:crotonobetainyl-CoA:carnitine CoA-transferase CaiB-like acyl-CoA transferase
MFISVHHEIAGHHLTARPSWRFKRRSQVPTRSGPVFGGDSDAILAELGYTADDITSLREKLVTTNSIISDG